MFIDERLITVDDFWSLITQPEYADRKFELINGVIVEAMSPGLEHGIIMFRLGSKLTFFVDSRDLGVVAGEVDHYLRSDRYNTRRPDIEFISKERLARIQDKSQPVPLMPDLVVEVKSPGNTYEELRQKAAYYLQSGVRIVWLIYPEKRSIIVYKSDTPLFVTLGINDMLDGGDVLPGFVLPLKEIFVNI